MPTTQQPTKLDLKFAKWYNKQPKKVQNLVSDYLVSELQHVVDMVLKGEARRRYQLSKFEIFIIVFGFFGLLSRLLGVLYHNELFIIVYYLAVDANIGLGLGHLMVHIHSKFILKD